ncbi:MAG: hypothetical protein U0M92_06585 [Bacilli bacterium]
MNFYVDTKTSSFDQNAAFDKTYGERSAQRGNGGNEFSGGELVIGLNAKEIPNIKQAITSMCDSITAELNKIQSDTDSEVAFKGESIKAALQTYITNVTEYCNNLTSTMKAFNDKLTDVRNQWEAATSSMGEKISGNAGQFATGTQYTETLQ